ncbi:MAG: methylglyoxal synthase [Oscillospiraceae bacterium]|nr:methylglyoxal synthase [Oscillospiraceae bacterium]MDO5137276.1 methylglyoxal synthase [Oscillospiraceae bacterium]
MKIALIAHDSRKELMVQFCIAYRGILSKHILCATGITATTVSDATGLKIRKFMAGDQGGAEQIVARVACNEIDLVLFFRDPISNPKHNQIEANLLQFCDSQNIPIATNIATAEVLIHGLERGDLEWRNIVNPNNSEDYI